MGKAKEALDLFLAQKQERIDLLVNELTENQKKITSIFEESLKNENELFDSSIKQIEDESKKLLDAYNNELEQENKVVEEVIKKKVVTKQKSKKVKQYA